jgi:hypothetical protein
MPAVESLFTGTKRGWDDLGSTKLAADAITTGALTIAVRDVLLIEVRVVGYSGGGDIASFRFNADSGTTYWSRYISSVASGVALVNNQNVSQTLARIFAVSTTQPRNALVGITNFAAKSKVGNVNAQTASGAAGTAGGLEWGGFEWVNTAAQITSIEMRTAGGAVNLLAGSGFAVLGRNL